MTDKDDLPVGFRYGLKLLGFALVVFTMFWTFVLVRDWLGVFWAVITVIYFWIVVGTLAYWAILIITAPIALIGQAATRGTVAGRLVFGLVGLAASLALVLLLSVSVVAHNRTEF